MLVMTGLAGSVMWLTVGILARRTRQLPLACRSRRGDLICEHGKILQKLGGKTCSCSVAGRERAEGWAAVADTARTGTAVRGEGGRAGRRGKLGPATFGAGAAAGSAWASLLFRGFWSRWASG